LADVRERLEALDYRVYQLDCAEEWREDEDWRKN
jgi:hypothetical protein